MRKSKNIFIILGITLLIVILAISSYFFIKQVLENRNLDKQYEDIQDIVTTEIVSNNTEDKKEDIREIINLSELYKINNDLVGWIKIDGTNIDYPVMQNEDYYLKEGDIVTISVKNTNQTMSQQLKNFFYTVVGKDTYIIAASHGGMVTATGK